MRILLHEKSLGIGQLEGIAQILIVVAGLSFIFGTQLPTIMVNIPLNNRVQTLNIDTLDETSQIAERQRFESRWNRWNVIRTVLASLASVLLIMVVRLI